MTEWVSPCGRMELRLGRWQDVLADVRADHCITDPPYSERTHSKQRHGRRNDKRSKFSAEWSSNRGLGYACLTETEQHELLQSWDVGGWLCIFTDSVLAELFRGEMALRGRTTFAPLACVQRGMNVRLAGDGPSSWTTWLVVSRPKSLKAWGTLPGAYVGNPFDHGENTATASRKTNVVGSKPVWLMREIVCDYSRPGDLIVDPYAGSGTTLLAAAIEGRRCLGAECDPKTFELAVKRLSKGYTPRLRLPDKPKPKQEPLL